MDNEEYAATQAQLIAVASIVNTMQLREFIDAGERAIGIGPIIDPTLWRRGHAKLEEVIKLAKALRVFQAEVERQIEGSNRANA